MVSRNAPGIAWWAAPGWDLARIQTVAITKITASTGKAYRSKICTRLWPKKAIEICSATMMIRQRILGQPSSVLRANVPLTLFTANQPMPAVTEFSPAGRMLPQ